MNDYLDRIYHFRGNPYEIGSAAGHALSNKLEQTINRYIVSVEASARAHISVFQTFLLGALECRLFHQQSLPLVAITGATPFQYTTSDSVEYLPARRVNAASPDGRKTR